MIRGRLYDRLTRRFEDGPGGRLRAALLQSAVGDTLEVGAGTGACLPHYPASVTRLVLSEPDSAMARRLAARLATQPPAVPVELVRARAADLPFADRSFDTVVATLVLCTVPDQAEALAEIRRVLRPGGSLLFAEHVRSHDPRRARQQDRLERPWRLVAGGCRPNRSTLDAIRAAGLDVVEHESGEMPGFPAIVRPYVTGRAVAPTAAPAGSRPNASATSS